MLPKFDVPTNLPVTYVLPLESTAIPSDSSKPELPALTAHCHEPLLLNLAMKMSELPLLVRLVLPKVAVP